MKHINPDKVELFCPVRDQCWCDLNSRAIEHGKSQTERQYLCGFESSGTTNNCHRKRRYAHPDVAAKQLTMQLS